MIYQHYTNIQDNSVNLNNQQNIIGTQINNECGGNQKECIGLSITMKVGK
jgi:hypothetical protein